MKVTGKVSAIHFNPEGLSSIHMYVGVKGEEKKLFILNGPKSDLIELAGAETLTIEATVELAE